MVGLRARLADLGAKKVIGRGSAVALRARLADFGAKKLIGAIPWRRLGHLFRA